MFNFSYRKKTPHIYFVLPLGSIWIFRLSTNYYFYLFVPNYQEGPFLPDWYSNRAMDQIFCYCNKINQRGICILTSCQTLLCMQIYFYVASIPWRHVWSLPDLSIIKKLIHELIYVICFFTFLIQLNDYLVEWTTLQEESTQLQWV